MEWERVNRYTLHYWLQFPINFIERKLNCRITPAPYSKKQKKKNKNNNKQHSFVFAHSIIYVQVCLLPMGINENNCTTMCVYTVYIVWLYLPANGIDWSVRKWQIAIQLWKWNAKCLKQCKTIILNLIKKSTYPHIPFIPCRIICFVFCSKFIYFFVIRIFMLSPGLHYVNAVQPSISNDIHWYFFLIYCFFFFCRGNNNKTQ